MDKNIISSIKGGLIATTAMTLLMLAAPMMGYARKYSSGEVHLADLRPRQQ